LIFGGKKVYIHNAMAILEVRNLFAGYGNAPVVRGIDFGLEEGDFVSVLGPNGSGKSTLIRALQGLLKDTRGEVLLAGRDLFGLRRREIARLVAFVPQFFEFAFEFSVFEVVAMGRYARQGRFAGLSAPDRQVIDDVLAMLEIRHLADKKIAHLSGGERQRVFIGRALAQDAPLLFLDEPSSHLDINYGLEIFELLWKLQEERGKTVLCAEHNINLVVPFSREIIFLKEGRIQSQGPPAELVSRANIKDVFLAEVDIRENLHSRLPEISLVPRQRRTS
jgi:iron complex transport system ATP-binding protein